MQMFKHYGATSLTMSEPIADRRNLALRFGAEHVIDPVNQNFQEEVMRLTDGLGYDTVIDASGSIHAVEGLLKAATRGGYVLYGAMYPLDYKLPLDLWQGGLPQYCMNAVVGATFAAYTVVPACGVYKIPDDADMSKYCLVEPTVCVIRAMDLSPIKHGQTVLVSGVGGIGSIMLDAVIHSGAAKITVSEPVAQKRENALAMGAQYVIDPSSEDLIARDMEITDGKGYVCILPWPSAAFSIMRKLSIRMANWIALMECIHVKCSFPA